MAGKTIKGITIELAGSTVKLGKALKDVLGESKSLEKQLKSVDNALKLDPTNTELLAQKQRILGDQIENTSEHLELLRKAEEKAAVSLGNYDAWAAAYAPIQEQIDKTRKKLTELCAEQKKMERIGDIDTDAYRNLSAEIKDLEASLKDLHQQAKAVDEQFGEPISTREYEQLQTEIVLTEAKLNNARKEAAKVADTLDKIDSGELKDVSKAAKDAEESLEGAKKEAADFADVLKANMIADGAKAIAESMADVVEETKEYQKIMGSLEVSSELAGYTTEQTREAYEKLYGVLADDQSSATTLANLQALSLEQDNLLALIDNVIGGWAKYGDSIPIDSLAESVNETIKAGKVTGTFADILNWGAREGETYGVKLRESTEANESWNDSVADATTAEDYFNLALQECSNETERTNLVLQAMADQGLSTIAQKWRENNEALVENNEANAQLQEQLGTLGETLMPITTILTEMLSKALGWFNGLDTGTQKFIIGAVLLTAVLTPLLSIGSNLLQGISAFMNISGGIPSLLSAVSGGFTGLSGVMNALPVLGVVAGIIAIGGSLLWLANNADAVKTVVSEDIDAIHAKQTEMATYTHDSLATQASYVQSACATMSEIWSGFWGSVLSWGQGQLGNLKTIFTTGLSSIGSDFSAFCQKILSGITTWGSNMKTKASSAIDNVKTAISSGLERVKSLFNFEWNLPRIKLPHFNISGSFSLNPPSVPSFGVQWYAKGGILNGAQIFGTMGNTLLGGGEAGPEAVLPLSGFYSELRSILASFMGSSGDSLDLTGLYNRLDGIYDRLGRLQVVLDTGVLVGETVDQYDEALAAKQLLAERGV